MHDSDSYHGIAVLQAVIGLDECCVADALAWHDALDEHILRDADMLVARHHEFE